MGFFPLYFALLQKISSVAKKTLWYSHVLLSKIIFTNEHYFFKTRKSFKIHEWGIYRRILCRKTKRVNLLSLCKTTDIISGIEPKTHSKNPLTSRRGNRKCRHANGLPGFRTHACTSLLEYSASHRHALCTVMNVTSWLNCIPLFCRTSHSLTHSDRCEPIMDPNTAFRHILLSEGGRKATLRAESQNPADHPERFEFWRQVLCREPLSGSPFYWEVEWTGLKV